MNTWQDQAFIPLVGLAISSLYGLITALRMISSTKKKGSGGCKQVITTPQSYFRGVHLSWLAAGYHHLVLVVSVHSLLHQSAKTILLMTLVGIGCVVTLYYAWLLYFKFKRFCLGCLALQLTTLLQLFFVVWWQLNLG